MGRLVIRAEAFVRPAVRMTAAGGKIHPAMTQHIEQGSLFRQLDGVVDRQRVNRDPEPQAVGPLGDGAKNHIRRR